MTAEDEFKASTTVTVSLSVEDMLRAGGLVDYDDYDRPVYAPSLYSDIVTATAKRIAEGILGDELRKAIGEQIREQVAAGIASALDAEVRQTDRWGNPTGEAKSLRDALADQAADQVRQWMKGSDRYGDSPFGKFLAAEVDRAVRADLAGFVKEARAALKKRMEARAAEAIAEVANDVVKGRL